MVYKSYSIKFLNPISFNSSKDWYNQEYCTVFISSVWGSLLASHYVIQYSISIGNNFFSHGVTEYTVSQLIGGTVQRFCCEGHWTHKTHNKKPVEVVSVISLKTQSKSIVTIQSIINHDLASTTMETRSNCHSLNIWIDSIRKVSTELPELFFR